MKKINNKGFLLIETLTVAAFSLTVLVLLFVYFKDLITTYNNSYNYNTVEGIYNARTIKEYLEQNGNLDNLSDNITENYPFLVLKCSGCSNGIDLSHYGYANTGAFNQIVAQANVKTVVLTSSNLTNLRKRLGNYNINNGISEDMKHFIKRLNNKDNRNRLIVEYNDKTFATVTFGYVNNVRL